MKIITPKLNWRSYSYGTISLCMIMKNEARNLARCLNSIRGLVDEIIIVDTGSADNSMAIAKTMGARTLVDPWQNDFSRPRNIAINHASCGWILILDPDEIILEKDHRSVKELTRSKRAVAYQMETRNYNRQPGEFGYHKLKQEKDPFAEYGGFVPSTKTRFFRNGFGIRFEGCWHELADYYIVRNKLPGLKTLIPIHHWTHEIGQDSIAEKSSFYLALGEKKVKEQPNHGQAWWELAVAEAVAGFRYRAIASINKAISLGFIQQKTLITLARCYNMIGNPDKGRLAFEKAICSIWPNLTHTRHEFKTYEKLTQ